MRIDHMFLLWLFAIPEAKSEKFEDSIWPSVAVQSSWTPAQIQPVRVILPTRHPPRAHASCLSDPPAPRFLFPRETCFSFMVSFVYHPWWSLCYLGFTHFVMVYVFFFFFLINSNLFTFSKKKINNIKQNELEFQTL